MQLLSAATKANYSKKYLWVFYLLLFHYIHFTFGFTLTKLTEPTTDLYRELGHHDGITPVQCSLRCKLHDECEESYFSLNDGDVGLCILLKHSDGKGEIIANILANEEHETDHLVEG